MRRLTMSRRVMGIALTTTITALSAATHAGEPVCACLGDLNGSGGIDASDLALVLGAWGSSDASKDLNADGTVNAADLSILLGAWGPCVGPANDDCADAFVLPSQFTGAVSFCSDDATTDGPANAACAGAASNQIEKDVWYHITAPITGTLTVDTCDSNFDTRLAVYEPGFFGAMCPTGIFGAVLLGCNDDIGVGHDCAQLTSALEVQVTEGETYTVRVGGYLGDGGLGALHYAFHPVGDLCESAIPVTLNDPGLSDGVTVVLTGNTFNAGASSPNANLSTCGGVNDTKDVWFKVTINCQSGGQQPVQLSASTCMPGTDFDTTLAIYSGACDDMTEIECNDDWENSNCQIGGFNQKSFISIDPLISNQTFFVRLAGWGGATGEYEIKFFFKCL